MEYERILISNSYNIVNIKRALEFVRQYIIEHERVLYGGIAIDYTLRNHGRQLYDDYVLPDYDFYSPNFIDDGVNIADILKQHGIEDIDMIHAKHLSTVRVRVAGEVVADITYKRKDMYDIINRSATTYKQFKVINVYVILYNMSVVIGLNTIYDPPNEAVFRLEKDIKRFAMINDIALSATSVYDKPAMKEYEVSIEYLESITQVGQLLLAGELLVLLLLYTWHRSSVGSDMIRIHHGKLIYKAVYPLVFYSTSSTFDFSQFKDVSMHNKIGDDKLRQINYIDVDGRDVIVYDCSEYSMQYNFMTMPAHVRHVGIVVLIHYLTNQISYEDDVHRRNYFISLYRQLNECIAMMERVDNKHEELEVYKYSPFFISSNVVGSYKESHTSLLLYMDQYESKLERKPQTYSRIPRYDPYKMTRDEYMLRAGSAQVRALLKLIE